MNRWTRIAALAIAGAMSFAPADAQVADKKALTLEGAKKIMAAIEAEAAKQGFPASVAIVDEGGNLLMLERLADWQVASADVSIGKARTAARFRRPTGAFEEIIRNGRTAMVTLDDFTPLQGGVPIVYEGKVIGAVGVSGNNPPKDEEIAIVGVKALPGASAMLSAAMPAAPKAPAVSYFPKAQVAEAFSKGAVLLDGSDGRDYMVHASRREKPGMAEVHAKDTDVIYVLDGAATFVTGGTVVDARTVAPDEIRGSSIQGGETRKISKGDVITVSNGTPHWFEQVEGPLTYYVVKVR